MGGANLDILPLLMQQAQQQQYLGFQSAQNALGGGYTPGFSGAGQNILGSPVGGGFNPLMLFMMMGMFGQMGQMMALLMMLFQQQGQSPFSQGQGGVPVGTPGNFPPGIYPPGVLPPQGNLPPGYYRPPCPVTCPYPQPQPYPQFDLTNAGKVTQTQPGGVITYTTHGGYVITANHDQVTITTPDGKLINPYGKGTTPLDKHTLSESGDPHEYLDGKYLKDWDGKKRSIILGDGTVVNMDATGPHGVTTGMHIFDGGQEAIINNQNNTYSVDFNLQRVFRDRSQLDYGETSFFGYGYDGKFHFDPVKLGVNPAAANGQGNNFLDPGFLQQFYGQGYFPFLQGPNAPAQGNPQLLFA